MKKSLDCYFSTKPFMKDQLCADIVCIKEDKSMLFFFIADVAGHGDSAHQLALIIKNYFKQNYKMSLLSLMNSLHNLLKGSRGAVAAAGRLHKRTGSVEYVGLGNISVRKFCKKNTRFISNEGIIGYIIPRPKVKRFRLAPGEALVLYTDGIRDHFQAEECPPDFIDKDAGTIVRWILKYCYKGNDDAACIAIRYKNN